MLKFLLLILLVSSGLKIVTGNSLLIFKSASEKICLTGEDDEQEKEEKKESKQIIDENVTIYHPTYDSAVWANGKDKIPLTHHKPYSSFFDQPNTPPPNIS